LRFVDVRTQQLPARRPRVFVARNLSLAFVLLVLGCCAVAAAIAASGVISADGIADASEIPTSTGTPGVAFTKLVPLDTESVIGVTVQAAGAPSARTGVYAQNPSGRLLPALNLTILDTTTGLTVYTGPLSGLPSSPDAPQRICAIGSTDTGAGCIQPWPADELHRFTITVSFPSRGSADNAYRSTGGSLSFVWGRG
jgi:hypothetical protein